MSRVKTKHLLTYQVQDVVLKDRAYSTVVVHRIRIAEMRVRFSLSPLNIKHVPIFNLGRN